MGYKKDDTEKEPLKSIKDQILVEYNMNLNKRNTTSNSSDKIDLKKNDELENWYLAEAARRAFDAQNWSEAKKLFLRSIEFCKIHNWVDGIRYAEDLISKCNHHL
jgi:hypothetical protein